MTVIPLAMISMNIVMTEKLNKTPKSIASGVRKFKRPALFFDCVVSNCFFPQCGQIIPVSKVNIFLTVCFQLHCLWQFWQIGMDSPQ